jgi:hypothetical protein
MNFTNTIQKRFLLFLYTLITCSVFGQKSFVYELEKKLMQGDKNALIEMAPYFDSVKKVTEHLGYHVLEIKESQIAKRIIAENCFFTEDDIKISDSTTSKEFTNFLIQNREKLFFSNLAQAFLLTPLENRPIRFEIREISTNRKKELEDKASALKNLEWVKSNKITNFIQKKDPEALLLIASALVKVRNRFNRNYFNENDFTELLQLLTGTEIAVENEKKELIWHIDKEYEPNAALNLLIYFSINYKNYKWNQEKSVFINPNYQAQSIGKETVLFQSLDDKNDSIAIDAFTQLTTCDSKKVIQLSNEYDKADIQSNYTLPTFPYRFLRQIVQLTEYCKDNNINYIGSSQLKTDIKKLDSELSFNARRQLEDKLISNLSLNDITALEYWALIQEKSYELTYSVGRILDIFYSKNWSKLLKDDAQLKLYLKKSKLFYDIRIIGICNNYLKKFTNSSTSTLQILNDVKTTHTDIKQQIEKAKSIGFVKLKRANVLNKENDSNRDYDINDIEQKIYALTLNVEDSLKNEDSIVELISKINYNQIGVALKAIENITFKYHWRKYTFMERDWGFFIHDNFDSLKTREEFLKIYNTLSEYDLYAYYMDTAGIDYKNKDNSFNYDKIYELLKYDVVTAFVGGGGGKKDNEVYSLIKLLEIKHKTTLGYPPKLCNSNGMYGCNSDDRAKDWMQFFIDNNLLKEEHTEPISYSDE